MLGLVGGGLSLPHTIGGRSLASGASSLLALPPRLGPSDDYKDSIYCWMIYQVGVEDEMVAYMYEHKMGVFGCNGQAVIGLYDPSGSVVDTDVGCQFGGHVKTGCKVAKGGPTALPLVFDLSTLPVMDNKAAAFPWIDAMASRNRRLSAKQLALHSADFENFEHKPKLTAEDTGDEAIIAAVRSAEEHFRADAEAASADMARAEAERRSAEEKRERSARAASARVAAEEAEREKSARAAAARAAAEEVARADTVHAEAAARGEAARAAAAKPDATPSGTAQEKQDAITKAAEKAAEQAADAAKAASDRASTEGERRAEQARERDAAAAAKDQQATKQMGEAVKKALQRNRVQQGDQGGEAAPVKSAAEEQLDAMTKALSESEQADAAAAREKMDAATRSAKEAEAAAGAAAKSLIDDATHSAQQVADASRHREQQAAAHTLTRTRTRTLT